MTLTERISRQVEGKIERGLPGSDKRLPRVKYDGIAKLTLMASAKGYVMARRSGCYPFVRSVADWRALSDTPDVPAAMIGPEEC